MPAATRLWLNLVDIIQHFANLTEEPPVDGIRASVSAGQTVSQALDIQGHVLAWLILSE